MLTGFLQRKSSTSAKRRSTKLLPTHSRRVIRFRRFRTPPNVTKSRQRSPTPRTSGRRRSVKKSRDCLPSTPRTSEMSWHSRGHGTQRMGIDAQPITALEEPKREANGRMPMHRNEMWCIRLRLPSHCRGGMNQFVQISLTIRKVELRWWPIPQGRVF